MARRSSPAPDTIVSPASPGDFVAQQAPVLAGRYHLLSLLGVGGAGSVYCARDEELDEVVALKMLRREAFGARTIQALRQEVKLARRVTHRNVARIFDIGEHEGERFLTMEFVQGTSLTRVIEDERVSVARALKIARSIGEGLAAAHEAGVIHCDLKPENVLVEDSGRTVITDFGIARLGTREPASTKFGWAGTPVYMAPEQLQDSALDERVDIYALGEILFELLTGRRTWPVENTLPGAMTRLLDDPPDPCAIRPELPRALGDVVLRMLARNREHRLASAAEAMRALAATGLDVSIAPTPARGELHDVRFGSRELAVAVLPLSNNSADDDYLSDGFSDELLDTLSTTPALRVRPRSLVRSFKGKDVEPREAGRELGVDAIVHGSVQRMAVDALRVTIRLVSVADGFQLWAKSFDTSTGNLLAVSGEAARSIGEALTTRIAVPARKATSDPIAIELYLRAREELGKRAYGADVDDAIGLLEEALRREPDEPNILGAYALARSRLSHSPASAALALDAAQRASRIAPHLADSWIALASVQQMRADFAPMIRACAAALRCSPHLAKAHHLLGDVMYQVGWPDAAIHRCTLALALDPSLRGPAITLGLAHGLLGAYSRAEAALTHSSVAEPPASYIAIGTRNRLAMWYRASLPTEDLPSTDDPAVHFARFFKDVATSGQVSDAAVDRLRSFRSLESKLVASFVGQIEAEGWAVVGHVEGVLDAIEFSDSRGLIDLFWMDRLPLFSEIRHLPRFRELRSRVEERAKVLHRALLDEGFQPTSCTPR